MPGARNPILRNLREVFRGHAGVDNLRKLQQALPPSPCLSFAPASANAATTLILRQEISVSPWVFLDSFAENASNLRCHAASRPEWITNYEGAFLTEDARHFPE
jgi:hypothetical protein